MFVFFHLPWFVLSGGLCFVPFALEKIPKEKKTKKGERKLKFWLRVRHATHRFTTQVMWRPVRLFKIYFVTEGRQIRLESGPSVTTVTLRVSSTEQVNIYILFLLYFLLINYLYIYTCSFRANRWEENLQTGNIHSKERITQPSPLSDSAMLKANIGFSYENQR